MSAALTGGCACGAVRYRLAATGETGFCHCRLCQRTSGAPVGCFTTVARADLTVERGADHLRHWQSTPFGRRGFCDTCGSLLTIEVDFQPDTIDVASGTLHDPAAVQPVVHIFCEEAVPWALLDDGLPRFPRYRPDTKGLRPGQTYPG